MGNAVRAIYEKGQLRLLDAVDLPDGQEVQLMIMSERAQAQSTLEDMLVRFENSIEEDVDEAVLMEEIRDGTRGQSSLSQSIIDERRNGP